MAGVEHVALLKRSDADIYCFHAGADWQVTADRLGAGHCFDVAPILVAPAAASAAQQHINSALKQSSVGSGWFACSAGVAVGALAAVAMATVPLSAAASAAPPESALTPDAAGSDEELAAIVTDPECSDDTASGVTDNALWDFVEPCATAEASKASDIRASLQASFGKHEASRLLANTKTTVARGADGHKFRMLRLGGQALKLKSA